VEGEIFVSYSRKDVAIVRELCEGIITAGYQTFFDQELVGGQRWWDTILDHIERCGVFMPVLSEQYLTSAPCRSEADYALALGKEILPVTISQTISNTQFVPAIAEQGWAAYFGRAGDVFKLVRDLNAKPPSPSPPDPLPGRPPVPIAYIVDLSDRINASQEMSGRDQHELFDRIVAYGHQHELADAVGLLTALRQRSDLVVPVAERIDNHLASLRAPDAGVAPPNEPRAPATAVVATTVGGGSSTGDGGRRSPAGATETPVSEPRPGDGHRERRSRRSKWTIPAVLGLLGFIVSLALLVTGVRGDGSGYDCGSVLFRGGDAHYEYLCGHNLDRRLDLSLRVMVPSVAVLVLGVTGVVTTRSRRRTTRSFRAGSDRPTAGQAAGWLTDPTGRRPDSYRDGTA
jgi:hypothetical protein